MVDKVTLDPDVDIDPDKLDTSGPAPEYHEVSPDEVGSLDFDDAKIGGDDE
jgi:hypothetical protein